MLIACRFAIFNETLTFKMGVSYLGGRQSYKCTEVALQAVGNLSTCSGCLIGMVSKGFSGHIKLMVSVGAEVGVVSIQTSGVISVGRGVTVALCSCREHFDSMLATLLAYRAVMHVGGFAKG